jgi:PTH1 family peptidyl-tRNA hydrolase
MARLIVGLGNPGKEYAWTRHNLGFLVIEALAKAIGAKFSIDKSARAQYAEINLDGEKIILVKPETFMNNSGEAVASLMNRFEIPACDVWVIHDDVALPFGVLRVRLDGSAGGHNGIKSIIRSLGGAEDFVRLRVGVGETPEKIALEDWVLSRFSDDEQTQLQAITKKISDKIIQSLCSGLEAITENLTD